MNLHDKKPNYKLEVSSQILTNANASTTYFVKFVIFKIVFMPIFSTPSRELARLSPKCSRFIFPRNNGPNGHLSNFKHSNNRG